MNTLFFQNLSLQKKFILLTTIMVIILMVILGFTITNWQRKNLYRILESQGRILAQTHAAAVANDLFLYDRRGMIEKGMLIDSYINEIFDAAEIDLIYLAVLDGKGKVIAHNDPNEYGKVYRDRITINALTSDSTVVQKFYEPAIGHQSLDFATPISNAEKRLGTLKFAVSLEKVDAETRSTILGVILFTLLLLAGGAFNIMILSRRFIRPITQLAKTMERADGDLLDVRMNVKGKDEIALLVRSFNTLMDRIKAANLERSQAHDRLLRFARTIEETRGNMLDLKVDISGDDEISLLAQNFNRMIDRIRESNLELKKTHEKLLQSQKLASLGILASGVAHEINNPLGGMFNCVRMLRQKGEDRDFRHRYLKLIEDGLKKIEATVGKLLWMSRMDKRKPQMVEINSSVEDVYSFIEYKLKKSDIAFSKRIENGISVFIDPHDLQQVMMNLMINAVQSMNGGGTLSVAAFRDNSSVILTVSDTGEGIDEKDVSRIFDPFYTTKPPGEGTGLGLWLIYEIVENYKGEISVQSKKGEGSTFTITFDSV